MESHVDRHPRSSWLAILSGIVLLIVGAPIAYGGGVLVGLGGSAYYLIVGVALIASGVLLTLRRIWGIWLYAAIYAATLAWAVMEVGFDFWPLWPRVLAPTVLAIPVLFCLRFLSPSKAGARAAYIGTAALAALSLGFGIASLVPHGAIYGDTHDATAAGVTAADVGDWTAYGRTNGARRFAPFTQITTHNIERLEVAWIARTGEVPEGVAVDQNTPLQIGARLFTCTPLNVVHALDADTGRILWKYDPQVKSQFWPRCRGLGYFDASVAHDAGGPALAADATCRQRIVLSTVDAQLIELDIKTGKRCAEFGTGGAVDLKSGLGPVPPSYYEPTSAPTVAHGLIIVGGAVIDGASVDVPSGVVRAFDARSGALRWAWDLGNAKDPNGVLSKDAVYTRGTPNVWAPISVDETLGLVYLPTGNPSPDHWGGNRTQLMEKYGSSIVALDLATGKVRWSFQTTHHDLWDYDVPAQATLYDMPDGRGGRVPALIQPTKRGQIFVLERRTGKPITPVEEKPVPQGAVPGDRTSPTQPYSVGMPVIAAPRFTEAGMWGISPLDQLWCRIAFRRLRYAGDFTPPRTDPSLLFPATMGGLNWGGASIDETKDYLIVNDIRMGQNLVLVPRKDASEKHLGKMLETGGLLMQLGTPYAGRFSSLMSPLNIPCNQPPYGTLTAIDLKTRTIAWQVPMGTTRDTGPLGLKTGLPMALGLPTIAGSLVTKGGLIFFAGTQDFYLRAIDTSTGRELWKSRMPVGAAATPMTYVSPRSGRQFVVISASGAPYSPVKGDYVIAYALPNKQATERK
jgi:quinate dehydrogenase (quinone)